MPHMCTHTHDLSSPTRVTAVPPHVVSFLSSHSVSTKNQKPHKTIPSPFARVTPRRCEHARRRLHSHRPEEEEGPQLLQMEHLQRHALALDLVDPGVDAVLRLVGLLVLVGREA